MTDTTAATAPASPVVDSVDNARATPEKEQPYDALGLKPDEYEQIKLEPVSPENSSRAVASF